MVIFLNLKSLNLFILSNLIKSLKQLLFFISYMPSKENVENELARVTWNRLFVLFRLNRSMNPLSADVLWTPWRRLPTFSFLDQLLLVSLHRKIFYYLLHRLILYHHLLVMCSALFWRLWYHKHRHSLVFPEFLVTVIYRKFSCVNFQKSRIQYILFVSPCPSPLRWVFSISMHWDC